MNSFSAVPDRSGSSAALLLVWDGRNFGKAVIGGKDVSLSYAVGSWEALSCVPL